VKPDVVCGRRVLSNRPEMVKCMAIYEKEDTKIQKHLANERNAHLAFLVIYDSEKWCCRYV